MPTPPAPATRADHPAATPARTPVARADKHDAILRAAIRVFARDGFFNAQVADVAREAGVASGTVYLYFRSKDDLLTSIFDRAMRGWIAEGRAAIAAEPDPIARLRAIARLHLDRLGRDRDLAVVFQVELRRSTKHMEQFSATRLREYLGVIRAVIADAQAAGVVRPGLSPTLAAKVFFGALDETATNWMLSRRRYSLVGEADAVVDVLVGGLAAPAAPRGRRSGPGRSAAEPRTRKGPS
jgi:TetR/AcrR family fatty acid metabolism transcriptional regulator